MSKTIKPLDPLFIRDFKAGKKADRLVAEHVMGLTHLRIGYIGVKGRDGASKRQMELEGWLDRVGISSVGEYYIDVDKFYSKNAYDFEPSRNRQDAEKVLEKIATSYSIFKNQSGVYSVALVTAWGSQTTIVSDESLPLAIVKTILLNNLQKCQMS